MRTALIGFYGVADEPRRTKRERVNLTAKRFADWAKRKLVPQSGLDYKAWRAQHPEYRQCWVKTGWHGQVTCVEPALPKPKPAVNTQTVAPSLPAMLALDTRPAELPQRQMPEPVAMARSPRPEVTALQDEIKQLKKLLPGRIQRYRDCGALRQSLPAHLR